MRNRNFQRTSRAALSAVEQLEQRSLASVTPGLIDFEHAHNVGQLNGSVTLSDTVGPANSTDVFRFELSRAAQFFGRVRVNSAPAELDLIQEVYDANGEKHEYLVDSKVATLQGPDVGFSSGDLPERTLQAGTYYMVVQQLGGDTPYLIRMTADTAGQAIATPRDLGTVTDQTIQEFVGDFPTPSLNDSGDYYKFKMEAPGRFTGDFRVDSPLNDAFLGRVKLIKDANSNGIIDPGEVLYEAGDSIATVFSKDLAAGNYFLKVSPDLNYFNYHLHLNADYAGDERGTTRVMGPLDAGKVFNDYIEIRGDRWDNYKFNVSSPRTLNLLFNQESGTSRVVLYRDANNNGVGDDNEAIAESGTTSFANFVTNLQAGNYVIQVISQEGAGVYQLTAKTPPDQAGNTLGTAKNLGTVNGLTRRDEIVGDLDTVDFYKFTMSAAGKIGARLDQTFGDADLALIRDANNNGKIDTGEILASSSLSNLSPDQFTKTVGAGTYFLRVNYKSGATMNHASLYNLGLHTDYAGETFATARNLGTLSTIKNFDDWASGPFGGAISDTTDLYKFTFAGNKKLTAKLTGAHAGQDLALEVYKDKNNNGKIDNGELVASVDHADSPNEQLIKSFASGTYFIRVAGVNGETNYHLSLKGDSVIL